jgi:uncharacterized damage-inducible protein DinB
MPTPLATAFLMELEDEAGATRRLLQRVPLPSLSWRPHPKSMSLGELALHVAQIPGAFAKILTPDQGDLGAVDWGTPVPQTLDDILAALEASLGGARAFLTALDDPSAEALWRATLGAKELFAAPRRSFIRALMFNHWYHHRGELMVYLRLLDVPLPAVYGPTADENPFAG